MEIKLYGLDCQLSTGFLQRLAKRLFCMPKPDNGANREQSWMTAQQIASWWNAMNETDTACEADLDSDLVKGWEHDARFSDLRIRPAKYPSSKMLRLWGHENVVGVRSRDEIAQRRRALPRSRFERISVPPDAKVVFLSHSMLDLKFARRIRKALAEQKLQPWLAEEEIKKDKLIFESVRKAIGRSNATFVLLGRHALGSAWVDTESKVEKVVMFVCDGADKALMKLLESWRPPSALDEANFDEALLDPLETAYRDAWNSRARGRDVLDRGAGGMRLRKERPDKFRIGAKNLLFGVEAGRLYVHPRKPSDWAGHPKVDDFDEAVARCRSHRRVG